MLRAHLTPGKAKSELLCKAFIDGAPKDAEGDVFYGVTEETLEAWRDSKRMGRDWYYIDNAYFDATRGDRFRVTKNRLQVPAYALHEAALRIARQASDGKRFDALELPILPWRPMNDGCRLAVAQSPWFMKLVGYPHWLEDTVAHYPRVVWRPWNRNKAAQMATLGDALKSAGVVITHSSAAAVEAVLAGVHITVSQTSALANMVCSADSADERRAFLAILADHEFTPDEMRRGLAWETLQR